MPGISFLGSGDSVSSTMGATTGFVAVQAGASNAKGAWLEAVAAAANTIQTAWMSIQLAPTGALDYLMDIGVGGAGSEVVLVADIPLSVNITASLAQCTLLLPLHIPPGIRVAVRGQNNGGSTSPVRAAVQLFAALPGGESGMGRAETCGAVTATSLGTSVDPGGTANTEGAWQVLLATTSFPYRWGCLVATHTNALANALSRWAVDVGVGGAGSEVASVSDMLFVAGSTADAFPSNAVCFPCNIPAGSRVSARTMTSFNTVTERLIEVVFIGVG